MKINYEDNRSSSAKIAKNMSTQECGVSSW